MLDVRCPRANPQVTYSFLPTKLRDSCLMFMVCVLGFVRALVIELWSALECGSEDVGVVRPKPTPMDPIDRSCVKVSVCVRQRIVCHFIPDCIFWSKIKLNWLSWNSDICITIANYRCCKPWEWFIIAQGCVYRCSTSLDFLMVNLIQAFVLCVCVRERERCWSLTGAKSCLSMRLAKWIWTAVKCELCCGTGDFKACLVSWSAARLHTYTSDLQEHDCRAPEMC